MSQETRQRKRKIKELDAQIAKIWESRSDDLKKADGDDAVNDIYTDIRQETFYLDRELTKLTERPLRQRADHMGVEIPREWEDEDSDGYRSYRWLSELGRAK